MTESNSNIPTHAEQHHLTTPVSHDTFTPYWLTLVVARWLQHKISQLLSQLRRLFMTRGRSSRWQRLSRQLIQAAAALLLAAGLLPVPAATLATVTLQPEIANPLPGDHWDWSSPRFADLDGDGDQDAFIGDFSGFVRYYQNSGDATSPSFSWVTGSLDPFNGVNMGSQSKPSFADLDADGDLDALIGESDGTLNYFQNTGSATSPAFIQRTESSYPLVGVNLAPYSAASFADLDADGDLDVLIGGLHGLLYYFQNTGSTINPSFTQLSGSFNPFDGVDVGTGSIPSFADLDGDGDLDAFIGSGDGTIHYFHNSGDATSPAFSELGGSLNLFNGVSVGWHASPGFVDVDGDGDLDTFIGSWDGPITYIENTENSSLKSTFVQRSGSLNPLNNVAIGKYSAPTFADLDGDGDLDAFIGGYDGVIKYYQNTGSATSPAFIQRSGTLNPFNDVDVGLFSTPSFADLDGDGDLDAFIGENDGIIHYFQNTGSATNPAFSEASGSLNPLNGVDIGWYSTPTFADLDGDGDLDAFSGEMYGTIKYFKNTGSATSPAFSEQTGTLNPLNLIDVGFFSTPFFVDLDMDGDLDLFSGKGLGSIFYYQNTDSATSPTFTQRTGTLNPLNFVDVGGYSNPIFADLDGDGDLDAFIGESEGTIQYYKNINLFPLLDLPVVVR
jgi:uncharacterized protein (DUF2141 family)